MNILRSIMLLLMVSFLGASIMAQTGLEFRVTNFYAIERRPVMLRYVDWEVEFSIINNTKTIVTVFGADAGNGLIVPVRYCLNFNEKTGKWEYPNRKNAPVPWKFESGAYKHKQILKPGESISFVRQFSRELQCTSRVMFTAQVAIGTSPRTKEIRSEEYQIPCTDLKQ